MIDLTSISASAMMRSLRTGMHQPQIPEAMRVTVTDPLETSQLKLNECKSVRES